MTYSILYLFLNLSRGFELLMKSMICYKEYKDEEDFRINLRDYGIRERGQIMSKSVYIQIMEVI